MFRFYKQALGLSLCCLFVSLLAIYYCLFGSFHTLQFLPHHQSTTHWTVAETNDHETGGQSRMRLNEEDFSLDFILELSDDSAYPFAAAALVFQDQNDMPQLADISQFTDLRFRIRCVPANVLSFSIFTIDHQITDSRDIDTYRTPTAFFHCKDHWQEITIDMKHLETPQWWLDKYGVSLAERAYDLKKVRQLQFGSTHQTPTNVPTRIQINDLALQGRSWHGFFVAIGAASLSWVLLIIWLFKAHKNALIADLKHKLQQERPLIAYQQLCIEPSHDKHKAATVQFLSTHYANPDLNLDMVTSEIGVSRTKISNILKDELGFTFTGYINKLRLNEAARLLTNSKYANIAEIAYSVGYKNVSYFNKLFKEEFGCTPNVFRNLSPSARTEITEASDSLDMPTPLPKSP